MELEAETEAERIARAYGRWTSAVLDSPVLEESGVAAKLRTSGSIVLETAGAGEFLTVTAPGANANKLTAIGRGGEYGFLLCQSYSRGEGGGIRPPIEGLEQVELQIDGPQNRTWHIIADLNQPEENIARQTAHSALLWAQNAGRTDQVRPSSNHTTAKATSPPRKLPKDGGRARATAAAFQAE